MIMNEINTVENKDSLNSNGIEFPILTEMDLINFVLLVLKISFSQFYLEESNRLIFETDRDGISFAFDGDTEKFIDIV